MEDQIYQKKWLVHDVRGGLAHALGLLANSYGASTQEERTLLLNLNPGNGLVPRAIRNGSMSFGKLQSPNNEVGSIGFVEDSPLNFGNISIGFDRDCPGNYRLEEPYPSTNITIESIKKKEEPYLITSGVSILPYDRKKYLQIIMANLQLQSTFNMAKPELKSTFNAVHFRNTDRKSDLLGLVSSIRERWPKSDPIYWATDDALSVGQARELLREYRIVGSEFAFQKPDGSKNLHQMSSRVMSDWGITHEKLWANLVQDLFHMVLAEKVIFSLPKSGWASIVPHLRKQERAQSTIFVRESDVRWNHET